MKGMNDSTHTMTRYLLGALSEAEQTALEEEYFGDPRVVDEVAKVESALVDDYVRGRLAPEARRRFEQVYLSDPRRRDRVKFAEALATRLDQASAPGAVSRGESLAARSRWPAGWGRFVERVGVPRPALGFALASLLIL